MSEIREIGYYFSNRLKQYIAMARPAGARTAFTGTGLTSSVAIINLRKKLKKGGIGEIKFPRIYELPDQAQRIFEAQIGKALRKQEAVTARI